ncbi:MAG TPA: DUF2478 domain-containing protein [Burkholderiaceae bacterium]|nr:DUF2478 domain-containing protein [Burkholderiaceae bacterium]
MHEALDTPLAAAIVDDRSIDIDAFLAQVVQRQLAAGRRVRGCLMRRPPREPGCAATMHLVDITTSQSYLVSQPMGTNSRACRADTQGFARASSIFRRALDEAPDLVISNRFGELEVRGEGFCEELLAVMCREIPFLTTVAARNAEVWREFTGGAAVLRPDADEVAAWIGRAVAARQTAAAA